MCAKEIHQQWQSCSCKNVEEPEWPTQPGKRVSVDQLVSPTLGLVAQMMGILTTKQHTFAMVFIDQATQLSYVHCQKGPSAEETLETKAAFEEHSKQ